jgi:hypothetical protein
VQSSSQIKVCGAWEIHGVATANRPFVQDKFSALQAKRCAWPSGVSHPEYEPWWDYPIASKRLQVTVTNNFGPQAHRRHLIFFAVKHEASAEACV